MIELEGLTKVFPGTRGESVAAVNDVTFSVNPGEVFGLLGPNGAGKTTTLRMLCTVLKPTAGFATVAGHDIRANPAAVRRSIGFLSANTGTYDRMTPREMVAYYGRLYGLHGAALQSRLDELFTFFQITDFQHQTCGQLSTGMKQKVSIARALVHNPPVLIFDEPTAGLDILVQRAVIQMVRDLRQQGKTILFSTHVMSEVYKLCDRVAIMAHGTIAACGTLEELRQQFGEDDVEEIFFRLVS
ncbi:MAG: ATP-binding cassette domain-containing protein [Bacteroidales bacterium]|nr:ATP-binding cassette domain-containing protein [Bacteroidales bacterium]